MESAGALRTRFTGQVKFQSAQHAGRLFYGAARAPLYLCDLCDFRSELPLTGLLSLPLRRHFLATVMSTKF